MAGDIAFIPVDVRSLKDLPEIKALADKLYTLVRGNTATPKIALDSIIMTLIMLIGDTDKPAPFGAVLDHIRFLFEQAEAFERGEMPPAAVSMAGPFKRPS